MIAPTSEELTRAFMLACKGDSKMTPEEREFVRDVTRRDWNAEAERALAFYRREFGESKVIIKNVTP